MVKGLKDIEFVEKNIKTVPYKTLIILYKIIFEDESDSQSFGVAGLVSVCNLLHLDYVGTLEESAEKIMGALPDVDSLRKENKKGGDEEGEGDDNEEDDHDEQKERKR
ncbi:hypothetical protein QE152_g30628 [Popillia japonica]|uniref:Uncharacterized protein n=1 Tax=Popillia japonica TaxID=7064 RepID=A0AAW1JDL7_POPJA